jgi:hypothetical protein
MSKTKVLLMVVLYLSLYVGGWFLTRPDRKAVEALAIPETPVVVHRQSWIMPSTMAMKVVSMAVHSLSISNTNLLIAALIVYKISHTTTFAI